MKRRTSIAGWALLGICLLFTTAARGRIIYVDDDATGANDGTSWANAFRYLQDAFVSVAPVPSHRGDPAPAAKIEVEIRVAQGTYKPHQGTLTNPWVRSGAQASAAAFRVMSGVAIKGGYAGVGAPDPNERDVEHWRTILSGDLNGDDVEVERAHEFSGDPKRAENSQNVVTSDPGGDGSAVLDGCVLTGATRGALENRGGSPTIFDCTFTKNVAQLTGGAVHNGKGDLVLTRCTFVANWAAQFGGAVSADPGSTVLLTECTLLDNEAGCGGAVAGESAAIGLTGCTFERNVAERQGAVHGMGGTLRIDNCTFADNSAPLSSKGPGDGGAVGLFGSGDATIVSSLFERNSALTGGAVYGEGKAGVRECVFSGNSAQRGGAIFGFYGSTIRNCVFAGNRAKKGGAADSECTGPEFLNCTFFANRSEDGDYVARSACAHGSPAHPIIMTNCILWTYGNEVWTLNTRPPREALILFSDVLGGWAGKGNVEVDPGFANPGYWDPRGTPNDLSDDAWVNGDFHVKSQAGRWDPVARAWVQDSITSPCIDAGDPLVPIGHELFPNGGTVNMGAYGGTAQASKSYFGRPSCETIVAGDINGDGRVDVADLNIMALHWLEDHNPAPPASSHGRMR